jgi:DNA-binding NarL/FixJ family response regulator
MNKNKKTNIFIVEDNKLFSLALKSDIETAFKKESIQINEFETGEACMSKFKEVKPQIVILDYHLNSKVPNAADGIEILDMIKKESPSTNVIILTSDDHLDIALKSFHHGASDYVVKTETKFRKINYSLANLFNVLEAKSEARKYKKFLIAFFIFVGLLAIGIVAIRVLEPSLLQDKHI